MHSFNNMYISDKEVAAMLNVKVNTLAKWRMKNSKGPKFEFVKIGRHIYYRYDSIESWIMSNRQITTKDVCTKMVGALS
ncbi:helix-turn-helix domain-containing protein [Campylobacter sp. 9BO]|uniref:helix-turn-helix domain-containing protein n=1 Tax=Campylobacter sp. 9BO TaxID=3424759 RepID=UPI003D34B71F